MTTRTPHLETGMPESRIVLSLAALAIVLLATGAVPGRTPSDGGAAAGRAGPPSTAPAARRQAVPLAEPGNAAFAAVAEVVRELDARPDTDWSRVDLEALRLHLRDMQLFTLEAEVVEREEIPGGLRVTVTGTGPEASRAVGRALRAHAPMLERETGWSAAVAGAGKATTLTVTADRPADAEKVRGLGYIGLMATGAHHRRHHWRIATGGSPHATGGSEGRAAGRAAAAAARPARSRGRQNRPTP